MFFIQRSWWRSGRVNSRINSKTSSIPGPAPSTPSSYPSSSNPCQRTLPCTSSKKNGAEALSFPASSPRPPSMAAPSIGGYCPLRRNSKKSPDGQLKKPQNRKIRLDLGYIFHQRRLAGRRSNSHMENGANDRTVSVGQYYHVVHRARPGKGHSHCDASEWRSLEN